MRIPMIALLGLALAGSPALAAKRPGPAAGRHAAAKPALALPAMKGHARFQHALHRPARGAAACGHHPCQGAVLPLRASFTWAQGLPPAAWVQANDCPAGTLATLARGHEDVVRCMPI